MTLKQRDEAGEGRRRRGPAIVSRARLARQQTVLEQFVAWLLLLLSFGGSALAGAGGWVALAAGRPSWAWLGAALAVQLVCTVAQWVYSAEFLRSWRYVLAVAASSTLAWFGYWPLTRPWLLAVVTWLQVPAGSVELAAGAFLAAVAIALDVWPERTLTHEE